MRVIETKAYQFEELNEQAKQKALQHFSDLNVFDNWWDATYEDANEMGLKITGFDIDRASYVKAEFIGSAEETAHKIIDSHGETCETYKTAKAYLTDRDQLINSAPKDENGDLEDEYKLDGELDDLDSDFLKSLSEDYRIILSKEYDYLTSDEAITEGIIANEYEFTETGKRI